MRNIILIGLGVWICFIIEYLFSMLFPIWLRPNLLLILIIFFNLYRGIRHSLLVAFMAGVLKDCFAPHLFGLNIVVFMMCAHLTTFFKIYIYESSSSSTRLLLIFIISVSSVLIGFWTRLIFIPINFWDVFHHLLLPEVFATTAVSLFVFKIFKQCALKLFA